MEKYDVIVVGAGNGGLSAADFACQRGLKTIIFEKHNLPGGAVSSFRRGRFEFEPSLHEMCEVGSLEKPGPSRQLFKDLDARVDLVYEDSCYTVICTDPAGSFKVKLPCSIDNFCQAVENEVPGSGDKVRNFLEYQKRAMVEAFKLDHKEFHLKDLPEIMNLFRMLSFPTDFILAVLKFQRKPSTLLPPTGPTLANQLPPFALL